MFGGNSNWRGPVWMPVNGLLIRALLQYYTYYGDSFKVECPDRLGPSDEPVRGRPGAGRPAARSIFLRDQQRTPARLRRRRKFQDDPHWRDHILFYEYFHGDNGAGIGASHQTGWTGLIATFLHYFASISATDALELWTLPLKFKPDAPTDVPALQR